MTGQNQYAELRVTMQNGSRAVLNCCSTGSFVWKISWGQYCCYCVAFNGGQTETFGSSAAGERTRSYEIESIHNLIYALIGPSVPKQSRRQYMQHYQSSTDVRLDNSLKA